MNQADQIRKFAYEKYVVPMKAKQKEFTIIAGDVHDRMGLHHRIPNVCNALKGNKFQIMSKIKLLKAVGPESGQAPSMRYTYTFIEKVNGKKDFVEWDKL